MRYLGIDYGRRRIGLALSDPTLLIASPFQVLENKGTKKNLARLLTIMQQNDVALIVLGLPLHTNGDESDMSREVRAFGQALAEIGYTVEYVDERYTSCQAEELIGGTDPKKKIIDKVAASIILQMYLDERRKAEYESKNQ